MSTQTRPALGAFADWVRATDVHASYRLPLAERAERILTGQEHVAADERRALAAALERWRYQYLNERRREWTAEDRGLADALDLAANQLARRFPRPPRNPRAAIQDAAGDGLGIAEARACFDASVSLEEPVRRATELTLEQFGLPAAGEPSAGRRRMLLYAPLYLSSHCVNYCAYCGFRYPLQLQRRHLTHAEALAQAGILYGRGFRHILLVGGDFPRLTTTDYYAGIIRDLAARGISAAVEIAPQSTTSYAELTAAGAVGVTLYQETYNEELYALYHPRGSKASYDWRLEGLERAADAGMERLGLGILLGLADPREDLLALVRHARYLQSRFPDRALAFSLPRIHQAPPEFQTPYPVDDETFIRLYCALRLAFPCAELVLSTREAPALRSRLAGICITQMSAGSSTAPGGYEHGDDQRRCDEQFPVYDQRSPSEVAAWLRQSGFEPLWDLPRSKR